MTITVNGVKGESIRVRSDIGRRWRPHAYDPVHSVLIPCTSFSLRQRSGLHISSKFIDGADVSYVTATSKKTPEVSTNDIDKLMWHLQAAAARNLPKDSVFDGFLVYYDLVKAELEEPFADRITHWLYFNSIHISIS